MSVLNKLVHKGVITEIPNWLASNVQFEAITGSTAYGVSEDRSDLDIYGFCIPPKDLIFPHLAGEIPGFGRQLKRFEQFQVHHVQHDGVEYDFSIFSIVKFFQLCMENNPNMIDALFVPQHAIMHCSPLGLIVREKRHLFLHKGAWHKFKGYAYSQKSKMLTREKSENPKRQASYEKYGYDVKFAYHLVRLILEAEQILRTHDLVLDAHAAILREIRAGQWERDQLLQFFGDKENEIEAYYHSPECTLPYSPDEVAIKSLLMDCLEMHYGDLSRAVVREDRAEHILRQINMLIQAY